MKYSNIRALAAAFGLATFTAIAAAPASDAPALEPTWESISEGILYLRCVACHNPRGQAKFLDLSTHEAVLEKRGRLVDEADPAESLLIQVVTDDEEPMPPTWSKLPRLTPEEISVLKEWIARGLP